MYRKLVAGVSLGVCTVALTGYGGTLLINMEPSAVTLEMLDKYSDDKYKDKKINETNKVGGNDANKKYLVANIEENKDWWEWSFRNRYQKSNTSEKTNDFENINRGYGEEQDSLGKKCEESYKKDKNNLNNILNGIKKFCTTNMKDGEELNSPS